MPFLKEIDAVKTTHVTVFVHVFIATVGPAALILFYFRPEEFAKLDNVRWIILSGALTLPLIVWHGFWLGAAHRPKEKLDSFVELVAGSFFTAMLLYAALIVAYVFTLSFRSFFWVCAALEALFFLGVIIYYGHNEREKKTG